VNAKGTQLRICRSQSNAQLVTLKAFGGDGYAGRKEIRSFHHRAIVACIFVDLASWFGTAT
jgi:hypothetical protein